MSSHPRLLEVRRKVLKENDLIARSLRERFRSAGIFAASFVSSPGSGKTTLLEHLLSHLRNRYHVAALVGDLATENDATRLARTGVPVKQITTGTICHLDARMVETALAELPLTQLQFLLIENVGNLVCPSSYDLGEELRFVLMSTTEGEDKPLKYPTIFQTADVAVITKTDLSYAVEFDRTAALKNIQMIRPGIRVFEVAAKSDSIDSLVEFLETERQQRHVLTA